VLAPPSAPAHDRYRRSILRGAAGAPVSIRGALPLSRAARDPEDLGLLSPVGVPRQIAHSSPARVPSLPRGCRRARGGACYVFLLMNPGAACRTSGWAAARFSRGVAGAASARWLRSVVLWGPGKRRWHPLLLPLPGYAAIGSPPTSIPRSAALARASRLNDLRRQPASAHRRRLRQRRSSRSYGPTRGPSGTARGADCRRSSKSAGWNLLLASTTSGAAGESTPCIEHIAVGEGVVPGGGSATRPPCSAS